MRRIVTLALALAAPLALGACELAPKETYQNGYRGTGMDTVKVKAAAAADEVPAPPFTPPGTDGPRAGAAYQNLQVLGNVSEEQFNYTMAAITAWVSPAEGCNYCHNPENMASDEKYTKVVARRMLQMTQAINGGWSDHVKKTGVTCWTCHRGQAVPSEHWSLPESVTATSIVDNRHGQNEPVSNSAYSSLPNVAVARYLLGGAKPEAIRVVAPTRFPTPADTKSVKDAEETYAMMMHITSALGVNCTYCHNAQSFQSWASSNPPRQTAWYGISMVRAINGEYIGPLAAIFPANRKGPLGDPYKVNCTTCHRGQNKPLGGYPMAKDYPALWRAGAVPAAPVDPSTQVVAAPPVAVATPAQAAPQAAPAATPSPAP